MEHKRKLLGQKIREERNKRGWTIEILAERAGISPSFLSSVERGERSLSIENLIKFSQIFEVTLDYLLKEKISDDSRTQMIQNLIQDFNTDEFDLLVEMIRIIKKFKEDHKDTRNL